MYTLDLYDVIRLTPRLDIKLTLKTPRKMHLKISSAEVVCCK